MKKFVLTAFVLTTVPLSAMDLGIDFRAGYSLATMNGYFTNMFPDGYATAKNGGIFGIGLPLTFNNVFSLRPEANFAMKGIAFNDLEGESNTLKNSYMLNYLDIPLFLNFDIPLKKSVIPRIYAGPYFGILFSSNQIQQETTNPIMVPSEYFEDTDYGITFGSGIEIAAGPGDILFDLRYSIGIKNIYDLNIADLEYSTRNRVFNITAGYGLDF